MNNIPSSTQPLAPALTTAPEWRREYIMKAVVSAAEITRTGAFGERPPPIDEYIQTIGARSPRVVALARFLIGIADGIADGEVTEVPAPAPTDCLQGASQGASDSPQ